MNPKIIALLALQATVNVLRLQGPQGVAAATVLQLLIDAAQAGKNVDAHMAAVAEQLKGGFPIDLDDLRARIEAAASDLHSDPSA